MRVLMVTTLGSLTSVESEDLTPGPGQVVIDVAAAGVNYVDGLFLHGRYQLKPPLPFAPGSEVSGTIRSVGPGVESLAPGTRVVAFCGLGGFATQVAVPEHAAIPIPDRLDFARAATFSQSYCTALFALRDRVGVRPGERVLVLGGGGGIGLAGVQVAKALGAEVLAGASSAGKREAAAVAGADAVVDTAHDLKSAARAWSEGGVDVVYDPVGGELADSALRCLREYGRYAVIGFTGGIPSLPLNQVLLRNRALIGVDWGSWSLSHPLEQAALLTELLKLVEDGGLDPIAPATHPFTTAESLLDDFLERRITGKVALIP
ncbi:NADPH:quinone oxidoreductase family protein [Actinocorallia longicatena]|uniref:NADPH:quinone oxidoreductase family protein n=1 Tax=Actinocorallia longicatena TaxID=111803 RepID=A0ABP6QFM4_9ACTN